MIYQCAVCQTYFGHAHDTSAHVRESLCEEHSHMKHRLVRERFPTTSIFDRSPVPDTPRRKRLGFRSTLTAAAS